MPEHKLLPPLLTLGAGVASALVVEFFGGPRLRRYAAPAAAMAGPLRKSRLT